MFRLRPLRRRGKRAPAVSHRYDYRAKFSAARPWEYALIRACLEEAVERRPVLTSAEITAWDGHTVTVELTVTIPWTSGPPASWAQMNKAVAEMITWLPIGKRLRWLGRRNTDAPAAIADWTQAARHPDLDQLDQHCTAYYGDADA